MKIEPRKRLVRILFDRLSQDDLRTLAFIIPEVDAYDNLEGESRRGKVISLLENLENQRRIGDLIDYIQEFRPDIELSELEIEPESEPAQRVELVNLAKTNESVNPAGVVEITTTLRIGLDSVLSYLDCILSYLEWSKQTREEQA